MSQTNRKSDLDKLYYYVDIELRTRKIIGWGSEPKSEVEVELSTGYHRIFVSKGQFNKLEKSLSGGKY